MRPLVPFHPDSPVPFLARSLPLSAPVTASPAADRFSSPTASCKAPHSEANSQRRCRRRVLSRRVACHSVCVPVLSSHISAANSHPFITSRMTTTTTTLSSLLLLLLLLLPIPIQSLYYLTTTTIGIRSTEQRVHISPVGFNDLSLGSITFDRLARAYPQCRFLTCDRPV